MILIGEYFTPLGEKNRVAVPKKIRSALGENLIITRGYEQSLILVDRQRWQELVNEINRRPLLDLSVRDTKRFLLGGAYELKLDSQGRFVIPEALCEYAGISEQVTFLGAGEWVEIWDSSRWQTKLDYLGQHAADIADRLSEKNGT